MIKQLIQSWSMMLLVMVMNVLFAATFSLGKLGLSHTGPLFLSSLRMLIAGAVLLLYHRCTRRTVYTISRDDWFLVAKTILFYNILAYMLEFWALQYMSSLKTNMLWSSLPFVSALLGYCLLHEHLTPLKLGGLIIGTAGTIPMMLLPDERLASFGEILSISLPEMAMFVEVVSYAYGGYLSKRLLSKGYPIELINGVSLSIGGLTLLLIRLCILPFQPTLVSSWPAAIGYAGALALISDVTGYSIYGYLITRKYTITFLNFSGFLCPIFGALFSKLIFDEILYVNYAVAFVLTLTGLFLFYKDELAQA